MNVARFLNDASVEPPPHFVVERPESCSLHAAAAAYPMHAHAGEVGVVARAKQASSAISVAALSTAQLPFAAGSHEAYPHRSSARSASAHGWLHGSASAMQPGALIW